MNAEDRKKLEYLATYREAQDDVEDIGRRIEAFQTEMMAARSAAADRRRTRQAGKQSDLSNYFACLEDMVGELDRQQCQAIEQMREIAGVINTLRDHKERRVLMLHYVDGRTWEEIADIMSYGIDNVYRLRRLALRHIDLKTIKGNQTGKMVK